MVYSRLLLNHFHKLINDSLIRKMMILVQIVEVHALIYLVLSFLYFPLDAINTINGMLHLMLRVYKHQHEITTDYCTTRFEYDILGIVAGNKY